MKCNLALETLSIFTANATEFTTKEIYTQVYNGIELFKIYSLYEGGRGFVICASIKNLPPVLGYSLDSTFFSSDIYKKSTCINNIDNLLESFTQIAVINLFHNVTYERDYELREKITLSRLPEPQTKSIPPLLTTHWSQASPYSDQTPGPTGCVATATAQIMKYHSWPPTGAGVIPAYSGHIDMPAIDIDGFVYQWDNMLNNGNGTSEQNNAVASLMLHLGCAIETNYMGSASSAFLKDVVGALKTHFRYDSDITYGQLAPRLSETTFSALELEWIVRRNLENKQPVQFAGAGHSIVCDGLDDNGMFHMNFGWGGLSDGYYNLFASSYFEEILSDVKPWEAHFLQLKNFSSSSVQLIPDTKFTTTVSIINTGAIDFSGDIILALADVSGVVITNLTSSQLVYIKAGRELSLNLTCHISNSLTYNSRRIYFLADSPSLHYGEKKIPCLHEDDNFIPVTIVRPEVNYALRLAQSLATPFEFFKGKTTEITVVLKNTGDTFSGSIVLGFVDKRDNITFELARHTLVSIAPQSDVVLTLQVPCPPEVMSGKIYTMKIFCTSDNTLPANAFTLLPTISNDIINIAQVTIKSEVKYLDELQLTYTPNYPEDISSRYNSPITFEILCKDGLDSMSGINLVLIDRNGLITVIANYWDDSFYKKGESKEFTLTPTIDRSLQYGEYSIGITAYGIIGNFDEQLISVVDYAENPRGIIVLPTVEIPFVRLTGGLPVYLDATQGGVFSLEFQLYLLPRDNDEYGFIGPIVAYLENENVSKVKIGEMVGYAVSAMPVSLSLECSLLDGIEEGCYRLHLEGWDNNHPELPSRIKGIDETVNDTVNVFVKKNNNLSLGDN